MGSCPTAQGTTAGPCFWNIPWTTIGGKKKKKKKKNQRTNEVRKPRYTRPTGSLCCSREIEHRKPARVAGKKGFLTIPPSCRRRGHQGRGLGPGTCLSKEKQQANLSRLPSRGTSDQKSLPRVYEWNSLKLCLLLGPFPVDEAAAFGGRRVCLAPYGSHAAAVPAQARMEISLPREVHGQESLRDRPVYGRP